MAAQLVLFWLRSRRALLLTAFSSALAAVLYLRLRRRHMGNCCASSPPQAQRSVAARDGDSTGLVNGAGTEGVETAAQPGASRMRLASCGPEAEARARARPRRHRPQVPGRDQWPAALSAGQQAEGEAAGTLLRGTIAINRNNPHQAYVAVPGRAQDILIDSKSERNRALHGDTVLVELIDPAASTGQAENRRPRDRICGIVRAVIADPTRPAQWIPGVINVRGRAEVQFQPLDNRYPLVLLPRPLLDACPEARQQLDNQQGACGALVGQCVVFKAVHSQWSDNILLFESGCSFCRDKRRRDGGTWDMKWDQHVDLDSSDCLQRSGTLTLAWKGWDAETLRTVDGGQTFDATPTDQQDSLRTSKSPVHKSRSKPHDVYSFRLNLLLPGQEKEGWLLDTLQSFARDGTGGNAAGMLVLPKTLDANQRRKCHALAQKMNLSHESHGEGTDRQIVCCRIVSKSGNDQSESVDAGDSRTTVGDGSMISMLPEWFDAAAPKAVAIYDTDTDTATEGHKSKVNMYAVQLQLPWPRTQAKPSAAMLRCLGSCDDLAPHLEAVSMNHCIPAEVVPLTPALEAECAVRDVLPESELQSRRDFRADCVFSIDPSGAKDLDDALHIRKCDSTLQEYEVGIHIADLSSFVKPGSALEQYAAARGTTTYLPTTNLPMIPRKLSENLCSLRGGVDRRAFSVVVRVDSEGNIMPGTQAWYGTSIVRSRGKVPYEVAQQVLEEEKRSQHSTLESFNALIGDICAPELQEKDDAVAVGQAICTLNQLAAKMRAQRLAGAAEHFILPGDDRKNDGLFCVDRETGHVRVRESFPDGAVTSSGNLNDTQPTSNGQESHQLVEEFMLLANRLVAQKLEGALETVGGGAVLRAQLAPSQARLKSWCELCLEHGYTYSDESLRSHGGVLDVNTIPRVACNLIGQLQGTLRDQRVQPDESVAVAKALQWIVTRSNTAARYVCTTAVDTVRAGVQPLQCDDEHNDGPVDISDGESLSETAVAAELEARRHYSLNCSAYAHFTSPIRRYADLIAHRQLQAVLSAEAQTEGESQANPVALKEALIQQGVSRGQVLALVDRTNQQAKAAKCAQQDCERLLALRYVADRMSGSSTGECNGVEMLAVALSVDEFSLKLLLPKLDIEHTVRIRELGCKSEWKGEERLLRVFSNVSTTAPVKVRNAPTEDAAETEEGEEGDPQIVDVRQLSVIRVLAQASFAGGSPRFWLKFIGHASRPTVPGT